MKIRNSATITLLLTVTLIITLACGKKDEKVSTLRIEQKTEVTEETKQSVIAYETLRRWTPQGGGIGLIILVSEKASKEEVMALASHLRYENLSKGWIWIDIFDLKEAYLHRDDQNYPEQKYFKHWLVNVCVNPSTGHDEMQWVGDGRDH